jgi:hypothetical protein
MAMANVEYMDPAKKWKRRAECAGLVAMQGKYIKDMTEKEIEEAFDVLSKKYGVSYIWSDR